jgi:cbb3-type cytochrome c oxidase subunit II
MDRFTSVLLVAGLGCFALAFVLSGIYPWMITDAKEPEATIEEVAYDVTTEFKQLKEMYPVAFSEHFPRAEDCLTDQDLAGVSQDDPRRAESEDAWREAHAYALRKGRNEYIGQVCWHCHSQYVRPVANEEQRFGRVLTAADDNNELQRPVLWGTRRVGPDLTHEGGRRSNDWHIAHFWDPQSTSPDSIMPAYTWFFDDGYQVYRQIDPEKAQREGIDPSREYPVPGVYATQADAEAALERIKAATPDNLAAERDRLVVRESKGPNEIGLSITAYLQWLGTWDASKRREVSE